MRGDDAAAAQSGYNYVIPWTAEGNASTRFKFIKNGKTYQLLTAADGGAWTETSTYAFVGDGKHFEKSGYVAWANYMKTHYVDSSLPDEK